MNRILGYVVSVLGVGTVVGGALPACATNDQTIFVRGALASTPTCTFTSDPSQPMLLSAHYDVGISETYHAVLLAGVQLVQRGDPGNNRAESNRVHINGAVVRVTEPGGTFIHEFTSLATGFGDPQTSTAAAYAPVAVVVIDSDTSKLLINGRYKDPPAPTLTDRAVAKTVLVNVKVFGTTLGGVDVESGEYQLPVEVCRGCLVNLKDGYDPAAPGVAKDPATGLALPNCDKPAEAVAAGASATAGSCFPGQDAIVSCRSCKGNVRNSVDVCDPKKSPTPWPTP